MMNVLFFFVLAGSCFAGTFEAPCAWNHTKVFEENPECWSISNVRFLRELKVCCYEKKDFLYMKDIDGWTLELCVDRGDLCEERDVFRIIVKDDQSEERVGTVRVSLAEVVNAVLFAGPNGLTRQKDVNVKPTRTPVIVAYDVQDTQAVIKRFLGFCKDDATQAFVHIVLPYNDLSRLDIGVGYQAEVGGREHIESLGKWNYAEAMLHRNLLPFRVIFRTTGRL